MYSKNTVDKSMQHLKPAFSQIELIFVIVVVGILAAVALPKLTGTANNAKLAMDTANMGTCIRETSNYYALYRQQIPPGYATTCNNIVCYTMITNDLNFTVETNSTAEIYCADVENVGGHLVRTYNF